MASATKTLRLLLPKALYTELRSAAREARWPTTRFAQELVRAGLDQWRRTRRRQEIAAYARQVAGSSEDLNPELERAGIKSLVKGR
jgi:hypothetical protein